MSLMTSREEELVLGVKLVISWKLSSVTLQILHTYCPSGRCVKNPPSKLWLRRLKQEVMKSLTKLNTEWGFLGSQSYVSGVETNKLCVFFFHPLGRKSAVGTKDFQLLCKSRYLSHTFCILLTVASKHPSVSAAGKLEPYLTASNTAPSSSLYLRELARRAELGPDPAHCLSQKLQHIASLSSGLQKG